MKNLKFAFIGICLGCSAAASGQSIERSVIGSLGGYSSSGNVSLSFTVGETVVSTVSSGSVILTQGFQQPTTASTGVKQVSHFGNLTVFPNPSSGLFQIKLENSLGNNNDLLKAEVYDGAGKLVLSNQIQINQQNGSIDLSHLPSGIYHLGLSNSMGSMGVFKLTVIN